MFYIKKSSSSQSRRFKPHFNRELGKFYGSAKDYVSDLKSKGLEPYDPKNVNHKEQHEYKASQWTKDVAKAIENNGGKTPGHAKDIIKQKTGQVKKAPDSLSNKLTGGFF